MRPLPQIWGWEASLQFGDPVAWRARRGMMEVTRVLGLYSESPSLHNLFCLFICTFILCCTHTHIYFYLYTLYISIFIYYIYMCTHTYTHTLFILLQLLCLCVLTSFPGRDAIILGLPPASASWHITCTLNLPWPILPLLQQLYSAFLLFYPIAFKSHWSMKTRNSKFS